jgi:hypothetical protein
VAIEYDFALLTLFRFNAALPAIIGRRASVSVDYKFFNVTKADPTYRSSHFLLHAKTFQLIPDHWP